MTGYSPSGFYGCEQNSGFLQLLQVPWVFPTDTPGSALFKTPSVFRFTKVHTRDRSLRCLAVLFRPEYSAHLGKVRSEVLLCSFVSSWAPGKVFTVHWFLHWWTITLTKESKAWKMFFLTLFQLKDEGCLRSLACFIFFGTGSILDICSFKSSGRK